MLSILLILPLLIGVLLPIVSTDGAQIRKIALAAPLIQLMFSLWFYKNLPDSIDLSWIPQIGLKFELGLDGISLPVVLLTALLTCLSIVATPADQSRPRLFFPLVLVHCLQ